MHSGLGKEPKLAPHRLAVLRYVAVGVVLLLLVGFWRLQIVRSNYYAALAGRNCIRTLPIMAPRGLIIDRDARVLVDNYPSFSVILVREHMRDHEESLVAIARGLQLDRTWLEERLEEFRDAAPYQPIVLKDDATLADVAFIEAHRTDLPEIELLMMYRRRYPPHGLGAHLFGYVGEVSKHEVASGRYNLGAVVGKLGLERRYNDILMGTDGQRRVLVDSRGREVSRLDYEQPVPGRPIRLTIDSDVQLAAERILGGRQGTVVALNPRTGDILALVSQPAFDPNLFAVRMSPKDWQRLTDDPRKPLLNRATQAQLAPGSVFKIIIAAAALEEGLFDKPFTVRCTGTANHYGRAFRCWRPGGHGQVDLHKAIVESCDIFFYEVGKRLGIERIAYYAEKLGLGRPTGVDLPSEEGGLVPSPEWKQRVHKEAWWPGDTISVAIGQGPVTVTPLQLAYALGGIASGGVFVRPHLLLDSDNRSREATTYRFPLKERTVRELTNAMWGVVNEGGTGALARLPEIDVAGKTGTAQLVGYDTLRRIGSSRQPELVDNAWFVGMAPRRNPEIVVTVLLEHGVHGASAAPLVREVIRAYYEKKHGGGPPQYAQRFPANQAQRD